MDLHRTADIFRCRTPAHSAFIVLRLIRESYYLLDAPAVGPSGRQCNGLFRVRMLEPLPARVDVAIIGAGYTGLAAARQLARAGASVVVSSANALAGAPARATAVRS